jgi:hypothetical protein
VDTSEQDEENGGFEFGANTQHCVGAIMMFLNEESEWPGINNDDELADRLREYVDWTAPHYQSEADFIEANTGRRR